MGQRVHHHEDRGAEAVNATWPMKRYVCLDCGAQYWHDHGHHHAAFFCPARSKTRTQLLALGRVYRPAIERE